MGDKRNYAALDWVIGEIGETLKDARQSLEAYVEDPRDTARIRFCLTHIHQVHGSLQMVEFHGASLFAEEMESLAEALMSGAVTNEKEAQEALMRSLLQLPLYLEQVKTHHDDHPGVVLPLLNDLRAVRKQSYLSETNLFNPDLAAAQQIRGERHAILQDTAKLKQALKKLREMFQYAAASVLRGVKIDENLGFLDKVLSRLEGLTRGTACHPTWQVAAALVEALMRDDVELSIAVRELLRHIARELRILEEHCPAALDAPPRESLLRNMLYYVARAEDGGARVAKVKQAYSLDKALLGGASSSARMRKGLISPPEPDAIRAVVVALQDELNTCKHLLDLVLSGQGGLSDIEEMLPIVKRIGDTLAVLGIGEMRKQTLAQYDVLSRIRERGQYTDEQLIDIANGLASLENRLEATAKGAGKTADYANLDEREVEIDSAKEAVLAECRSGLDSVKEAIVEAISSQWNTAHLPKAVETLHHVQGGLQMIPLPRPAAVLEACSHYIRDDLIARTVLPVKELQTLAEALASIDYFLERLASGHGDDLDMYLDLAEDCLSQLGYEIGKATRAQLAAESLDESAARSETPAAPASATAEIQEVAPEPPQLFDEEPTAVEPNIDDGVTLTASTTPEPDTEDENEIDEEIIEIFVEEAAEVQQTLHDYVPGWAQNLDDEEALTTVRRAFHTLKGSGRMVDAQDIGELGWALENMLNRILDRTVPSQNAHVMLVEQVLTLIPALVDAFQHRRPNPDPARHAQYIQWANDLAQGKLPAALGSGTQYQDVAPPPSSAAEEAELEHQLSDDEDNEDQVLWEIFASEATTHLATINAYIDDMCAAAPLYSPPTDQLQRALHTLKGSAHMAGVTPIAAMITPLEAFVKELRSYQLKIDDDILQLLQDAVAYTNEGLEQIYAKQTVQLLKLEQFVARVQELNDRVLAPLIHMRDLESDAHKSVDPRLLAIFMAEEMSLLLDADLILARWQQTPESLIQELPTLAAELHTLSEGAKQANLPEMSALSDQLQSIYRALIDQRLAASDDLFACLIAAHEKLLDMVDQVAAGQTLQPVPDALQALLDDWQYQADRTPAADAVEAAEVDDYLAVSDLAAPEPQLGETLDALEPTGSAEDDLVWDPLSEASDETDERGPEETAPAAPGAWSDVTSNDEATVADDAFPADFSDYDDEYVPDEAPSSYEAELDAYEMQLSAFEHTEHVSSHAADSPAETASADEPAEHPEWTIAGDLTPIDDAAQPLELLPDEESTTEEEIFSAEFLATPDAPTDTHSAPWTADAEEAQEPESPEFSEELQAEFVTEEPDDMVEETTEEEQPAEYLADSSEPVEAELVDDVLEEDDETFADISAPYDAEIVDDLADEIAKETFDEIAEQDEAGDDAQVATGADMAQIEADDFDPDILEIFLEESSELIEELDEAIHRWESNWDDAEPADTMKRALHTLKGGARLSGLRNLGELTHDYETFLITSKGPHRDPTYFQTLHTYQDAVLSGVRGVRAKLDGDESAATPVVMPPPIVATPATLEPAQPPAVEVAANVVPLRPSAGLAETDEAEDHFLSPAKAVPSGAQVGKRAAPQEMIKVSAELLEELVNLAGETSISRGRLEQQISDLSSSVDEVDGTLRRLHEQLRRLDIETEAQVLFRQEQMAAHEHFDPLEMDRYSQLQQLTRSLMESASDLVDLKTTLTDKIRDTETLLLQQSRINSALHEGLMRSRMVPFSRLVPRLRRIVRQVAGELGKHVNFELDNVEGEMDRSVLERMVAPLEHMLRNAVDHGIEMPSDRLASGKPETGRILLSLAREGGDILLRLADDGRGIHLNRVREKAIERGLMAADAGLSDHEVMQFILQAGFSTAENVTQISGRGVGMDVVAAEIKLLGGSIVIDSKMGVGTQFTVRLPFTVSVNRALMVQLGQEVYAIPLNTIEGIVRVSPFELEHYYTHPDARFEYAGENYQVRHLGSVLNREQQPRLEGQALPLPVILVRSAQHTMALQVDALMGSREIVVKSLGPQFAAVQGLSGATVMGDGSVVVILDPHALVRREVAISNLPAPAKPAELAPADTKSALKTIMVVDDSVTVRKVTSRFLEREGFNVVTAKDGVDALQLLQEEIPDLMLLDIEMPRMDGFEVARNVRSSSRLKHIPIVMITSRTGDKHREHALSIGVNDYVGKPYQEEALLAIMTSLLNKKDKKDKKA